MLGLGGSVGLVAGGESLECFGDAWSMLSLPSHRSNISAISLGSSIPHLRTCLASVAKVRDAHGQ